MAEQLRAGWEFLKRPGAALAAPSKYAKYEQNRKNRKFLESWKQGRPWLRIDSESMTCTWCTDVNDQGQFTWTSAKVDTLNCHESSNIHTRSVDIMAGRHRIITGVPTEAQKSIESLNKAIFDKLLLLFRTVHALSRAGRPYSDFVWMAQLDQAKGLDTGSTYLNSNSAKEFAKYIAKAELNKIGEEIKNSKFVSILSDGSTDTSVTEVEIIYARLCIGGEIKV
ncbi:PREDICTED: zinc finger protein 862-like [Priapulus caudatus]|uniref:Zinc finger protein 862-like n=1 Tax=Priapulus caudatus TaxID=37621 RepID=A0ABM1ESU5_PRICU|nr:PREDICTED: zinc finger protein 862-like [Priapulus caudatus]